MVKTFFKSFDEIFSLPASKKILVDNAYLYVRLNYKWNHGLDVKIKHDKPLLFKKLKELIHEPLTYDIVKTEFTVSQLKYLHKLLNLEFVITCFQKTDKDIAHEKRKQMGYRSKIFKKIQSILHKYGNLEFSKKNEQSLIDEICLNFRHKIYVESKL
jgi:hypothetical protein